MRTGTSGSKHPWLPAELWGRVRSFDFLAPSDSLLVTRAPQSPLGVKSKQLEFGSPGRERVPGACAGREGVGLAPGFGNSRSLSVLLPWLWTVPSQLVPHSGWMRGSQRSGPVPARPPNTVMEFLAGVYLACRTGQVLGPARGCPY